MKLALFTCLAAFTMAIAGFMRFGPWGSDPPLWLDVVFLASAAAFVASLLLLVVQQMHRSVGTQVRRDDRPDTDRDES